MPTPKHESSPMFVADQMRVDHPRIDPDLSLADARDRLFYEGEDRLVVADEAGVLGLISKRALDEAEAAGADPRQTLRSVLKAPLRCRSSVRTKRAAREMRCMGATSVLVVRDGQPVGVFSPEDTRRETKPPTPPCSRGGHQSRVSEMVAGRRAMPSAKIGRLLYHLS